MCVERLSNRLKHQSKPVYHLNVKDGNNVTVFIQYLDNFINQ